ncbi:hypothetical protein A9Q99_08795 [Gammaproteobacteria bacterium 45_16_T64]|nr:hypothetical protein A9Q99_08795 [Gammaproteobacteria bacterium 45_16_T64]
MLVNEEKEILELLEQYTDGELSRNTFTEKYGEVFAKLKEKLGDVVCYPLNIIIPSSENSEQAWQQNMREMYLREIESLDSMLEEDEPSYTETLSEKEQKELCSEAMRDIPKTALDRDAKQWIEDSLVEDGEFIFFDEAEVSKFGASRTLYQANLVHESILMSALSGDFGRLDFEYAALVRLLKDSNKDVKTVWVRCSDVDGFSSIENTCWYTDENQEVENLNWIEHTSPEETQWGACYLVLLPANKEWMLVHSNDYESFKIQLHGSDSFINGITERLKN